MSGDELLIEGGVERDESELSRQTQGGLSKGVIDGHDRRSIRMRESRPVNDRRPIGAQPRSVLRDQDVDAAVRRQPDHG